MITNKQRLTSQKKIILDYLKNTSSHPSAKKVYLQVKKKLPQISLGTVYRNLKQLKKQGELIQIFYQGTCYFDANLNTHQHFICQNCARIIDFCPPEFFKVNNILGQTDIGLIKNYKLTFYGICHNCLKKEKK
jgi:Fur family transcriptional regulator, peroxide stress response regulator